MRSKAVWLVVILVLLLTSGVASGSFAQSIVSFTPGDPYYLDAPIENILGPPDEGHNWREVQGSIGHLGSVVVDMGQSFHDVLGPDLLFWFGGFEETFEVVEGFLVEVSVDGSEFDLVPVLPKEGDRINGPVPLFSRSVDLAPSSIIYRYLRITDTGTDQEFRGVELNAIEVIPEPATFLLFGLGGLALLRKHIKE
jgi:hypothetical protein